jgi:hypothetical protein
MWEFLLNSKFGWNSFGESGSTKKCTLVIFYRLIKNVPKYVFHILRLAKQVTQDNNNFKDWNKIIEIGNN